MPPRRTRVLYVTDLAYEARGRRYCDEDIVLSSRLRGRFDVALCHPIDTVALMESFEVLVVRNSGPVVYHRANHDDFLGRAAEAGVRVFTELTGKADMAGKQYLLELYAARYPVIPTIEVFSPGAGFWSWSRKSAAAMMWPIIQGSRVDRSMLSRCA